MIWDRILISSFLKLLTMKPSCCLASTKSRQWPRTSESCQSILYGHRSQVAGRTQSETQWVDGPAFISSDKTDEKTLRCLTRDLVVCWPRMLGPDTFLYRAILLDIDFEVCIGISDACGLLSPAVTTSAAGSVGCGCVWLAREARHAKSASPGVAQSSRHSPVSPPALSQALSQLASAGWLDFGLDRRLRQHLQSSQPCPR
ncbi:hypothetical protein ElyMa_001792700 [Elysia marginata]|uniref:Uncharacterized protein n=1 Tax=Elysia marginata TaxID=1093978 RepID=A0AAV4EE99_9GAST|nr:hypothetical protein ElyMa_001792700 [Elysia marginata]